MSTEYAVLRPTGILTAATVQSLSDEFKQLLDAKTAVVLVDLQQVNFIDSSGLGTLVSFHTRMRLANGRFYLCAPQSQARSLFDISDMDQVLAIFESEAQFRQQVIQKNMAVIVP